MRGYLRLDLTDNCNIRCVMCQIYNSQPVTAMRFMDFDRFVRQSRGGLAEWSKIQLGNVAEPTVHPRFGDFLRYLRSECDATIYIVTNGKLLHRYADLINSTGNCLVQVSMDSVRRATHEHIREGSSYDRVISNLALLDLKRTEVLLSFTLMKSNIDEYEDMVGFCRERGYHMSAFPMILRDERGVIPLSLMEESLWFNIGKLHGWHRKYYRNEYDKVGQGENFDFKEREAEFECHAHERDLVLDAAGNGILCGKQSLGSLSDRPLEQMWNSPEAAEFRREVDRNREPCIACDYRQRCLRPSMALFENHFSENILRSVGTDARKAIASDRSIPDNEALDIFIREIGSDYGIFDIQKSTDGYTARRVRGLGMYGETFQARNRHELHATLAGSVRSQYDPILVESRSRHNIVQYLGKFWALPLALGRIDLRHESSQKRPGVIAAQTLPEVLAAIDRLEHAGKIDHGRRTGDVPDYRPTESGIGEPGHEPLLVACYRHHNMVSYSSRFWGLPLSLGELNLAAESDRSRPGVIVADTLDALKTAIDSQIRLSGRWVAARLAVKSVTRSIIIFALGRHAYEDLKGRWYKLRGRT